MQLLEFNCIVITESNSAYEVAKHAFEATWKCEILNTRYNFHGYEIYCSSVACVKFQQNGVIKLYTRHNVFGSDRGRSVFLLFMQQLVSSDPYKMLLCTRVVCRENVQLGTSLKKKKEKKNEGEKEGARYARCFLRVNSARRRRRKFYRAFTRPCLIRLG